MELPDEIWCRIILHACPRDYVRIGQINSACRRILSTEWFVKKWLKREWANLPIIESFMIHMCDPDVYPTITTLVRVAANNCTSFAQLGRAVLSKSPIYTVCVCPFCVRYGIDPAAIVRNDTSAAGSGMQLRIGEAGHAGTAATFNGNVLCRIANISRAYKRGIMMVRDDDCAGVLRPCTFIASHSESRKKPGELC